MNNHELVKKYLSEYPNLANMTLAKKIYNENKLLFASVEVVRSAVRKLRGVNGNYNRIKVKDETFFTQEAKIKKYNLPESIEQPYEPYKIIGNKGLIFGDLHIPFQDNDAISIMFDYTINRNLDFIIILGDLADCYQLSNFIREPNVSLFKEEKEKVKQFLKTLRSIFPNTKIYYKMGNHEKRFENYLKIKAPEIYDNEEFQLKVIFDLYNLGIENIDEDKYISLNNGLRLLHFHEYGGGIVSPVNQARTLFLKTKHTALAAHGHRTSNHTEKDINGQIISCWSIGCLCGLNPKYRPLNFWNHGFAIYEKQSEKCWHVNNKMIIQGEVV